MSKQILFFGNERLATGVGTKAQVFSGLIEAGFEVKALIVSQKIDKDTEKLEIVKIARANGIEVKSYKNLKESAQEIADFGVRAAVLAAYGKIVPKEMLDLFEVGIINIHPSLLPKHRGSTPIESTILSGEPEAGVSIMQLAAAMDAGPIYAQEAIRLSGEETKQALADTLDNLGKDLLLKSLDDILNGDLKPVDQPSEGATYDNLITKRDGTINWHEPWSLIDRKIRAYSIWPRTRCLVAEVEIIVLQAHFETQKGEPGRYVNQDGTLGFYCSDGLVAIDELIPVGSKQMSGKEFLVGYSQQIFS